LNCVANGRVARAGIFSRLFVQPAAGDAGTSLGAAALAHVQHTGRRPSDRAMTDVHLGPSYSASEVYRTLAALCRPTDFRGREAALLEATVDRLIDGKVVGWFQGRLEFGPRALGARSILADPRLPHMRDLINSRVKKREEFRPFAPAVLLEKAMEHFDLPHASPFMLETCDVRSPLDLPAITHVDRSARVQTVDRAASPRFARLLDAFERRSGCPLLLNTSFNMKDEPIVCTPAEALICFIRSNIETLVIEDFLVDREDVAASWAESYGRLFEAPSSNVSELAYTFL
jgi:carbamoyltransferase